MSENQKLNPDFDPLIRQGSLEYYGKRSWLPAKVSTEPYSMESEQKVIPFSSNSVSGGSMETFPGLQGVCP